VSRTRRVLGRRLHQAGMLGSLLISDPLGDGFRQTILDVRLVMEPARGQVWTGYPRLEWQATHERRWLSPTYHDCLLAFTQLADAHPARILEFAQQWGVLGICEAHGEPSSWGYDSCAMLRSPMLPHDQYWEPIDSWRRYAREVGALLSLAADLEQGEPGEVGDWEAIVGVLHRGWHGLDEASLVCEEVLNQPKLTVDDKRWCLTQAINERLKYSDVRPEVVWDSGVRQLRLSAGGPGGLSGLLALQIAAAITSRDNLLKCYRCRKPYVRDDRRAPARGGRQYCWDCNGSDGHAPYNGSKRASEQRARARKQAQTIGTE
jgi:hypothetical protein